MLRTTCTKMSSPTRSPVRNVADLGWPIAGPVQVSTSSMVISSACIWCSASNHMHQNVEPNQIAGAERRGFRLADRRAGAGIHFFDGHIQRLHLVQRI